MDQVELKTYIKRAMCLWAVALFCIILLVTVLKITVGYYERALSGYEEKLADPVYLSSDRLWSEKKLAEEALHKQERLLQSVDRNGLDLSVMYRIIGALPEELYAWELILDAQRCTGELQGAARADKQNAISIFVERLLGTEDFSSVRLSQMQKISDGAFRTSSEDSTESADLPEGKISDGTGRKSGGEADFPEGKISDRLTEFTVTFEWE